MVSAQALKMSSLLASDKEDANCQVERGACDAGGEVCGAGRPERAAAATQGARTLNMKFMPTALDVSKLSDWSKAVASCRVESRACDAGRDVRAGRRGS